MIPLVQRVSRALSGWLAPAWGEDLRLEPDLDAVEALAPEREALWARVGAAGFLTDAEKREAVGWKGKAEEIARGSAGALARKYRPDQARDEQGRWVDEGSGEEGGGGDGEDHEPVDDEDEDVSPRPRDEFDEPDEDNPLLHRVSRRGPGQTGNPRLDTAFRDAKKAARQTRELDPNWQPPQSFTSRDNIEGQIAHYQAVARAAEARYAEITRDAIPGTNPSWGINRLQQELRDQGYQYTGPTRKSPGSFFSNPRTGEEVRIMERPPHGPRGIESLQKFHNNFYYRYRPRFDQEWGSHITIPNK